MDVCGGLISEEATIIPVDRWVPDALSISEIDDLFRSHHTGAYSYANYSVFLAARVLALISSCRTRRAHPGSSNNISHISNITLDQESHEPYPTRWQALMNLLEDWYLKRTPEMRPLLEAPPSIEDKHPFPQILYGNAAAISGNQLYHTSAILMQQAKPKNAPFNRDHKSKSVLWHARQICGISISNTHHGCWNNALQPLWIAGKVMSHPTEHKLILTTLRGIQRETGWAMEWRAEDLRDLWGNEDD